MKIVQDKVLGGTAAGEKRSRHYWPGDADENDVDYEALFRAFMEKLFANRGAFTVGGSLSFEFQPKAHVKSEKLISAETLFYFHQMEEGIQFRNETHKNDNYTDSAIDSYHYQKKTIQPAKPILEEFMPMI